MDLASFVGIEGIEGIELERCARYNNVCKGLWGFGVVMTSAKHTHPPTHVCHVADV